MTIRTTIIINDCHDHNAATRQVSRAQSLLKCSACFIGVEGDLEAAGNLIDVLDAVQDEETVVLVNVAPRNGRGKKWPNGTPFGYFWYKKTLVLASIDGLTLSLVKKFGLVDTIKVLDIPTCLEVMGQKLGYSDDLKHYISQTQFRSYEFLPRVAAFLSEHQEIPHEILEISEIPDVPQAVWWVDNFGNCKTTLLLADLNDSLKTYYGLSTYARLKDVPDGEAAFIVGSSGLGEHRFIEICQQGGRASDELTIKSGSVL